MEEIKLKLIELLRRNDRLRSTLLLGKIDDPNFYLQPYEDKVLAMAAHLWHRCSKLKSDKVLLCREVSKFIFSEMGIQGKTEKHKNVIDDPNPLFLHRMLDTKKGSPISVAALFSILASQVGLEHECVSLPSQVFIRIRDCGIEYYIDAFDSGRMLTQAEFQRKFRSSLQRSHLFSSSLFERMSHAQLLARLVQQLKHIYIIKGKALEALRSVDILTALFPQSAELTRDRGILYCEMEYFSRALTDLRQYLRLRPQADDVGEIKKLTTMLKTYREVMN